MRDMQEPHEAKPDSGLIIEPNISQPVPMEITYGV